MLNSDLTKQQILHKNQQTAWSEFEYFDNAWENRVACLAKNIDLKYKKVMDLGCGEGKLANYLSSNIIYIPVDYTYRENRNIICNFNAYEFPDIMADVCFASGVMEYIDDWKWFVQRMCKQSKCVIMSYCATDRCSDQGLRDELHWVNHLSVDDVVAEFRKYNFESISLEDKYIQYNVLMKFKKVNFIKTFVEKLKLVNR